MSPQLRRLGLVLLATALAAMVVLGAAGAASGKKKHKRLRLTCDQTTEAIFQTAQQFRAQYNAMGFTIEEAPYGILVGSGCKNVGKLTRQGSAYMADVHHSGENDPPFPGETNPNVVAYRWQWSEIVSRTKKGRIRTTVTDFRCVKESRDPPYYDPQELPC